MALYCPVGADESRYGRQVDGELVDGEPHGRGVLIVQGGCYEGEFRGKPNGAGTLMRGRKRFRGHLRIGRSRAGRRIAAGRSSRPLTDAPTLFLSLYFADLRPLHAVAGAARLALISAASRKIMHHNYGKPMSSLRSRHQVHPPFQGIPRRACQPSHPLKGCDLSGNALTIPALREFG
jgi:hypothetical protein